ncbi:MAG: hypothetical protein M3R24_35940 [Chloroflexota bacterium]|nr:hypothetical protein [Chloroflexota bacterium]PLS77740.1 MAG: hypothetical protein CYG59_22210 [Chloroflexota bacterium]
MTQAAKRRRNHTAPERAGGNLLSLLATVALIIVGFYYVFPAVTSGDWLWFSTRFDAQPRSITVINRGERTEIGPADPRFRALVAAFNASITGGYRNASLGFSDETWEVVDRNGLLVEAAYTEPVRLHIRGGFEPTNRLGILVSGKNIHTTQVLFRSNAADWSPLPLVLNDVAPLKSELTRQGLAD